MAVAALVRFWQFYESALETRPLLTNMANTAVLFAVGDTIGQGFSHKRGLARAVIYGGLIYCVPAHVHYNFIDKAMTYLATTKQLFRPSFIPLAKTCTELFVYWFYFTSVLYHLSMGLMEGIGLPATLERVKRNFWKTCTSGWVYWGPGNFLNFTFVPVRHQLMIVNVLGIGWTTFLSLLAAKNRLLEASGQRKQEEQEKPRPE